MDNFLHFKNYALIFFVAAAYLFTFSSKVRASETEKFSWDADSSSFSVDGNPSNCLSINGSTVIDNTEKNSGTGSLRHTLSDPQQSHGCDPNAFAFAGNIYDGSETYFRWWMKIDSNFNWGSWGKKIKFGRMTRSPEKSPPYTTLYLYYNKIQWASAFTPNGADILVNMTADFEPNDGQCRSSELTGDLGSDCTVWREYIFYVKRNTCPSCRDGAARLYINRQLAASKVNITFGTLQLGGETGITYSWSGVGGLVFPQLCQNGTTCNVGGIIWIDDISTDTVWNSMLGPQPNDPSPINVN